MVTAPNQVWTWDITWLKGPVRELYFRLYLIIDLFSRKLVRWQVWEVEDAEHAADLIKKTVISEKIHREPLVLHSDNGSPIKVVTFQVFLEKRGIQSSYSRPRVSNDNPYSEAIFRTLKYLLEFPMDGFATVEKAREWTARFVHWHTHDYQHSGINFVTLEQRHTGVHPEILKTAMKFTDWPNKKIRNFGLETQETGSPMFP